MSFWYSAVVELKNFGFSCVVFWQQYSINFTLVSHYFYIEIFGIMGDIFLSAAFFYVAFVICVFSLCTFYCQIIFTHCVKSVRIWSYSGPHFLAFGLNTEWYSIYLRIQAEYGKMRIRITPNMDYIFHAATKLDTNLFFHFLTHPKIVALSFHLLITLGEGLPSLN